MNLYEWILLKERLGIDHPEGETHLVLVTQKTATPQKMAALLEILTTQAERFIVFSRLNSYLDTDRDRATHNFYY